MSWTSLAAFFGLALIDCVNPSALAATVVLLTRPQAGTRVAAYVAAVFATYVTFGTAVLLGLEFLWGWLDGPVGHGLIALLGAAMLGYALSAPEPKVDATQTFAARSESVSLAGVAALGVGVTAAEFSTAAPYLAALALLAGEDLSPLTWAPLLAAYNLVFIGPPVLLAALWLTAGAGLRLRLQTQLSGIGKGARTAVLWLMGLMGFYLLGWGGGELASELGWLGGR